MKKMKRILIGLFALLVLFFSVTELLAQQRKTKSARAIKTIVPVQSQIAVQNKQTRISGHFSPVISVAFSQDGKAAVTGDESGSVIVWDVDSGKALQRINAYSEPVMSVAFLSNDGKEVITAGFIDLNIWDFTRKGFGAKTIGRGEFSNKRAPGRVESIELSPDGRFIAGTVYHRGGLAADGFPTAFLWDLKLNKILEMDVNNGRYHSGTTRFSPDGKYIVLARNSFVKIYDLEKRKLVWEKDCYSQGNEALPSPCSTAVFTPDSKGLLIDQGFNLTILNLFSKDRTKKDFHVGSFQPKSINDHYLPRLLMYSPDGKLILTETEKKLVLLNAETGEVVKTLDTVIPRAAAFSSDSRNLLTSGSTPKIYDIITGRIIKVLYGKKPIDK